MQPQEQLRHATHPNLTTAIPNAATRVSVYLCALCFFTKVYTFTKSDRQVAPEKQRTAGQQVCNTQEQHAAAAALSIVGALGERGVLNDWTTLHTPTWTMYSLLSPQKYRWRTSSVNLSQYPWRNSGRHRSIEDLR